MPNKSPNHFTIIKRHVLPSELEETSGLIIYKGLVWTFNDSGGKPAIYGYSLTGDTIQQVITFSNAINKDWEDIAQDDQYFYIGDFGNNTGTRDSLVIYKVAKVSIPAKGNVSIIPSVISFRYPDYTPVTLHLAFSAFDCEALISVKDSLYIFTKDWTNGSTTIYSLPKTNGRYKAKKINKFNSQGLITGADYVKNKLILVGYRNFMPFIWFFPTSDLSSITESKGKRLDLTSLETYQTEGVCFDGSNNILISSEKTRSPAQIIELSVDFITK